jgi:hypothetical protein
MTSGSVALFRNILVLQCEQGETAIAPRTDQKKKEKKERIVLNWGFLDGNKESVSRVQNTVSKLTMCQTSSYHPKGK